MKWSRGLALLAVLFVAGQFGCASVSRGLPEPKSSDHLIVIGAVHIDLFEYRQITQTYRSDVEVIIAGRYMKNGKIVHRNFWVRTDDRGYFCLPNVPKGDYTLRGFRFQTVGPSFYMTVINPLRTEKDQWQVRSTAKLPEAAYVFPYPAQHGIVNLRHNYFIIDRGKTVHQKVYHRLDNLRLATGKILQEPDVLSYFRSKFPNSRWFRMRE